MARDPGSLWSPLAEDGRQGSNTKTQFIVHSTGDRGTAAAIFSFFNRNDVVVESTFVVGMTAADPTRQLLDSASTADANYTANQRAIAVEVVGTADDDYTEWQVQEIVRLGRWAKATHPIEPRVCPTHSASGFGWHVMFGAPGPWTPVAKSCPGKLRIKRLQERVFPAVFAGNSAPILETGDPDMRVLRTPDKTVWFAYELEVAPTSDLAEALAHAKAWQGGQFIEVSNEELVKLRTAADRRRGRRADEIAVAAAKLVGTPDVDEESLATALAASLNGHSVDEIAAALRGVLREGVGA